MYKIKFIAFVFVLLLQMQNVTHAQDAVKTRIDSLSETIHKIYSFQVNKSHQIVEELYQIAEEHPEHPEYLAYPLYWNIFLNQSFKENDSSLQHKIDSVALLLSDQPCLFEKALLNHAKALSYIIQDQYISAFQLLLKIKQSYKTLQNKEYEIKILCDMADIFAAVNNYNVAKIYYQDALLLTEPTSDEYFDITLGLYRVAIIRDRLSEYADSLQQLIPAIKLHNNPFQLALIYLTLTSHYHQTGAFEIAQLYRDSLLDISEKIDNERFKITMYNDIGMHYLQRGIINRGYDYMQQAHILAQKSKHEGMLLRFYSNLSNLFIKMKNTDSALFYLDKYRQVNNNLIKNNTLTAEIYQNYLNSVLEGYQDKIKISEQELSLRNRHTLIIILIAVAVIVIILFFVFLLQQQKRNLRHKAILKDVRNKELEKQLKHEEKIQRIQQEKHKEVLESKTREISSYSLLLASKNTMLQEISSSIQSLSQKDEQVLEVYKKISGIIKKNTNINEDWNDFLIHFNEVHPDFFQKLKSFTNDLTENDLRLCAYIKIGIPTKNLSQILNVAPDSVKMHRYRVKKKLGLVEEENLYDFIRSI